MASIKLTQLARTALLCTTLAFSALTTLPALAGAPMVKTSAPGYFRFMLGDFEITALSDGTVDLPVDKLLNHAPAKTVQALARSFLKPPVETSVNAYLVNTGNKLLLIDAGAGALFGPTLGKLIANLNASGYKVEDIDDIYITHLHPDHVGGLAANGQRVFPNAVVHADQRDSDFWLSPANLERAPADSKGFYQGAVASLSPYVKASKYQAFDGKTEFASGVTAWPSYGHTAGHSIYVVQSQGQKLVLVGDLIHVGAVQFAHPAVTIKFDSDTKAAAATRRRVFTQAAQERSLVAATHIQFPGIGHLVQDGKAYRWVPINFTQMR